MTTTVVKTIGSAGGRDYSTLQAWHDASPASLTGADEIWQGQAYNDSEFYSASTNVLSISGLTTDATRYLELTTGAGQSFMDNASVRTLALVYNQSNGVGIRTDTSYSGSPITEPSGGVFFHISKIQLKTTTQGLCLNMGTGNLTTKNVIAYAGGGKPTAIDSMGSSSNVVNTLCYIDVTGSPTQGAVNGFYGTNNITGSAIIRASNKVGTGVALRCSVAPIVTSCAIFGFSSALTIDSGSKNNATDLASLTGTSNQTSVTYNATTPFTGADSTGTIDMRTIIGTVLSANGFLDSTNAPKDISGTTRANPPTIGVWELVSGGGGGGAPGNSRGNFMIMGVGT